MKHPALIVAAMLVCFTGLAQSGKSMDPEVIHRPADSTGRPVIQLEVTINSIRLLKVKSDSTAVTRDFTFKKGSTLTVTCVSPGGNVPDLFTKLNNEPEKRYYQPLRLVARGRHTLTVRAVTTNGAESSLKISFTVKE